MKTSFLTLLAVFCLAVGQSTAQNAFGLNTAVKWRRDTLAVQGLIYHFSNRKWIIDDNYAFIMQNRHTVEFNTENVQ